MAKKKTPKKSSDDEKTSQDELWKGIITELFEDFVAYFMPDLYVDIDWTKKYTFLEQELTKIYSKSMISRKFNDKLVSVFLKNGNEQWILIHIEIQAYTDPDFAERMFIYYYRAFDRYAQKIVAMALFADDSKSYKPDVYRYEYYQTEHLYRYRTYKVLEQNEEALINSDNPFAMVILAALYRIRNEQETPEIQYDFKLQLIRMLIAQKIPKSKILHLLIFIDSLVKLSEKYQRQINSEIETLTNIPKDMKLTWNNPQLKRAFETYFDRLEEYERIGLEKGREEGIEKGIEKGKMLMMSQMEKERHRFVFNLFTKQNWNVDQIVQISELDRTYIEQLLKENGLLKN